MASLIIYCKESMMDEEQDAMLEALDDYAFKNHGFKFGTFTFYDMVTEVELQLVPMRSPMSWFERCLAKFIAKEEAKNILNTDVITFQETISDLIIKVNAKIKANDRTRELFLNTYSELGRYLTKISENDDVIDIDFMFDLKFFDDIVLNEFDYVYNHQIKNQPFELDWLELE